jgi:hypothetical protein
MIRALCLILPLWCASAAAAAPSPEQALLQADEAMNQDITEQGNDIHAMLTRTGDPDISYSNSRHAYFNLHQLYKQAPIGRTPGNTQFLHTEYVTVSAAQDLGVTYGVWNTESIIDSIKLTPLEFYKYFVFGFNDGLWTSKWSPRGAPRVFYLRYLRVWQHSTADGVWRLIGGPYFVTMWPPQPLVSTTPTVLGPPGRSEGKLDAATAQAQALAADAAFSRTTEQMGLRAAYLAFAADDIHLVIRGQDPLIGIDAIKTKTIADERRVFLNAHGSIVAADGDMVFTYGLGYGSDDPGHTKPPELYAHVWCRVGGVWKVCVSLIET